MKCQSWVVRWFTLNRVKYEKCCCAMSENGVIAKGVQFHIKCQPCDMFHNYFWSLFFRNYLEVLFVLYVYVTLLIVLLLNFQALCTKLLCCNFSWFENKSQTCISHSITVYFSGWKVQGTIYLGQQGQFPKTKLEWSISHVYSSFFRQTQHFQLITKRVILKLYYLDYGVA